MFSASIAVMAQAIVTESTSNSTTRNTTETTVNSPPPSAIAPGINSMNNDLCAVGVSGAAQTQILGIAIGSTFRDKNCERLKLSKNLYDMGMKVAAVATLCQDERVFVAMLNAGTPCPINGKIGVEARKEWDQRDLARVAGADKIGDTGFYAAPINIRSESKENTSDQSSCTGYTGDDPVVKNRIGC
jgi:hypothetical protein